MTVGAENVSSESPNPQTVTPRSLRRQHDRAGRESEWSPSTNRRQPPPLFSITNTLPPRTQPPSTSHQQSTPGPSHSGSQQPFSQLTRASRGSRSDENDPFVISHPTDASPPLATPSATATSTLNRRSIAQLQRRARERLERDARSLAPATINTPPNAREINLQRASTGPHVLPTPPATLRPVGATDAPLSTPLPVTPTPETGQITSREESRQCSRYEASESTTCGSTLDHE
ncbi:hypothetical protein FIBSPDRAFT_1043836 [Athelia psychrophila]|uniref:Uncharacterized protein n=1 Tax=Athelia psychrophila TaxID=1759441 RepID=A0A166KQ61_9AGAM|nr:hypothetical protein FIBSPDRAFT_1043836 [Fibularhizoctonia sp. CBS 109695]